MKRTLLRSLVVLAAATVLGGVRPAAAEEIDLFAWSEYIPQSVLDGNISEAARVLSMHRRSLQRKLAKFPVSR